MDNPRKKYYKITEKTGSDDIYAILDEIDSDLDEELDNEMNDSDTEFVVEEDIDLRPEAATGVSNILTPNANIHKVSPADNNEFRTRSEKETTEWKWTRIIKPSKKIECKLQQDVLLHFNSNPTPFDVFEKTVDLNKLISHILSQTNLYATQKGRNFVTNDAEMKAFLGMNSIMSINKLPTIEHYWSTDRFIGNQALRDVMTKSRFKQILQNIHFSNNDTADKVDKGNKVRPLINHFNEAFQSAMSNSSIQSIDEHMIKFKGRSSMKQYIKSKPIKWGFKFWFRCDSKTGYLYDMNMYLGRKESTEYNLGESVVLNLASALDDSYCTLVFDNFFASPNLVQTLFDKKIYSIGTVRSNRKNMPKFSPDKSFQRGDSEFKTCKNVICVKWMDNRAVTMIGSNVGDSNQISSVLRRQKGASTKSAVPCPILVKHYNHGMGGVDLCDQYTAAYRLDRRSKFRFYLRIFFDLLDVAMVNSFVVYDKLHPNELSFLDFKLIVSQRLIGSFTTRIRAFPCARPTKRRAVQLVSNESQSHFPEYQETRRRCVYCSVGGIENRTFVMCLTCNMPLCLQKERNCFLFHHQQRL